MGYHVAILRSAQGRQLPIPLDEARAAAVELGWTYHDGPPTLEKGSCTLWHRRGELWTKTPGPAEVALMLELAHRLKARVRGDEFETYESPDKTFSHPDDEVLKKQAEAAGADVVEQSRRQQRNIRNAIVLFFALLGAVGYFVGKLFEQ